MFFLASKLFWLFFAPSHLAVWLTIAGAVLLFLKRERLARWCITAGAGLFVAFGFLPVGVWLMQPLENRYPHPALPAQVDGILVLDGGFGTGILRSRGAISSWNSEPRLVGAFALARRYPEARVVFSGSNPFAPDDLDTVAARHIFGQLGLAPSRLLLEGKSRNTWENFVFAKALAKPKPGEVWVLCTSAYHLPRAMGIARRLGWKMIPWATDYMTAGHSRYRPLSLLRNLERADAAVHEWIGLMAYRLTGRTAPAP